MILFGSKIFYAKSQITSFFSETERLCKWPSMSVMFRTWIGTAPLRQDLKSLALICQCLILPAWAWKICNWDHLVNKPTPGWLTDSASHEIKLCTYHQFSSPGYKRTVTKMIEKLVQYKSSKNHRKLIKFIVKTTVGTF